MLAAAGEDADLLSRVSEGGTLAAFFAEASAAPLLDLLLAARAQGAAAASGLLPASPARTPLSLAAVRTPSGLLLLGDRRPDRLRRATTTLVTSAGPFGEAPLVADLRVLDERLRDQAGQGGGQEPALSDWQDQLAEKDRRIAELEAEIARLRSS
ncbi:MAG TPA: hypothetical protein VF017_07415 [Thermoanaerobaculia bacterium]|nr:hypothetical protein [Thermoanaerobaculia bacterium]